MISSLPSSPHGPERSSSQEANKENANPQPQPPTSEPSNPQQESYNGQPSENATQEERSPGTLPVQLTSMLTEITTCLKAFPTAPPHTLQRLAELILTPRRQYRSLCSYLHALDRVVHVTSTITTYPLPLPVADMSSLRHATSGDSGHGSDSTTGPAVSWLDPVTNNRNMDSDESMSGALLTPIPWLVEGAASAMDGATSTMSEDEANDDLEAQNDDDEDDNASVSGLGATQGQSSSRHGQRHPQIRSESTETIEGPNGMGSIETVSITLNGIPSTGSSTSNRGVSQGELLRQEQTSGVVSTHQLGRGGDSTYTSIGNAASVMTGIEQQEQSQNETEGQETTTTGAGPDEAAQNPEDEEPHARGPEEITVTDTGKQSDTHYDTSHQGGVEIRDIDIEAAVGRKFDSSAPAEEGGAMQIDEAVEEPMDTKQEPPDEQPEGTQSEAVDEPKGTKRELEDHAEAGASKKVKDEGDDTDRDATNSPASTATLLANSDE